MARKVGVDATAVEAAAVAQVRDAGLASLSMAAVAGRLGIRPPSLYAHVRDRAALRRIVAMHAARELHDRFQDAVSRPDPVRSLAHAYRRFALEEPGLYASLLPAPDPARDPAAAEVAARPAALAAAVIAGAGLADDVAVHAVRAFRAALHGFVDLELHGGFALAAELDASFEALLDLIAPGASPTG